MAIHMTSILNTAQKEQIQSLITACRKKEPVTLSFPYEDADLYALYEADGTICSACAFMQEDEGSFECAAFTDPKYRGQGMFSELLDTAIDELPEDCQFLFYTDHKSADAIAVLNAYEAEPLFHEHMMELPGIPGFSNSSAMSLIMEETMNEQTRTYHYTSPYGTVFFSVFSDYYYLYGFEIQENLRGHGYGKQMLLQVLFDLAVKKSMPVRLQVSGDNIPAMELYKKTGFRITETLSCYLY